MEIKQVQIKGTVAEMARTVSNLKIDVPFADGVDIATLTKGDKNPLFVTIEAVNDTISKGRRRYTPEVISEISKQINEKKPDGYIGHLKDEDRPFKSPRAETIWLGSVIKNIDGKVRLFVKGYVFPYAKELRQYLKAAKASSKSVAVSIYGQAQHIWNSSLSAYDLTNFNLESIDWARNGAEGVPALGFLGITKEMTNDAPLSREEVLATTTFEELKQNNPNLVSEMESSIKTATVAEMDTETKTTISEMEAKITSLTDTIIDNYVDKELKSKIVSETARKVIKSIIVREIASENDLVKVAEKIGDILRKEETKAIVSEMSNTQVIVNPQIDNRKTTGDSRKFTVIK